jgi:pimeloyl-ACP methyl ester carboxylesterase
LVFSGVSPWGAVYAATCVWLALQIGIITAVVFTLAFAAAFIAGRWFFVENYPDEIHFARTGDGWRVAVVRYRAAADAPARAHPVLLVHGIASNRLTLDLTAELSLARALAAAGWDTWLVDLRGRGLSTRPRLFTRYTYDWSFDEYVEQDLPAAIEAVRRATGRERIHAVGASLGGMALYALLSDPRRAGSIASAVTLGSPATFKLQGKYIFSWPLRNLRFLRHKFLMRLLAPLAGYWHPRLLRLLHEPENMTGEAMRRFMVNGAANFARNELLQLGDWLGEDRFRSIDHRRDYRAELGRIQAPILFVAGNKDRLAPPPSVKDAYEAVASADKKLVIASRGQAFGSSYGHFDLTLGANAPKEIYPLVGEWLAAHDGVAEEDRTERQPQLRS